LTVDDFCLFLTILASSRSRRKATSFRLYTSFSWRPMKKDQKVVLIIDEAQGLKPELLEEIRLLSNFETAKSKLLQIVLVGQPELNHTLCTVGLSAARQRINLRYHLMPLSKEEMIEYIEKRLRTAGGNIRLFSEKAIREDLPEVQGYRGSSISCVTIRS
jgi:general secretion pathway protein A